MNDLFMNDSVYLQVAGTFECVVDNPKGPWLSESKDKGTPYVRVPVKVLDGSERGKSIVWNGWLSEAACDRTVESLVKAFGFNGDLQALYRGDINFDGLPCQIVTENEHYEGKMRCKAKWLNPTGGGEVRQMDQAKAKTLLANLQRRSLAIAKNIKENGAAASPPPFKPPVFPATKAQPELATDDDVPF